MNEVQFVGLMQEHQAMVHKVCYLYRDSKEDREDLFQEITFQLWKAWPHFKGEAKVTTWMYRIALNTAIAVFRKKRPDIEFPSVMPDMPDEPPNEEHERRQEQLFAALKQLDDTEKAIITLYFEEMSYRQIAEVLGINENNVGVKINRIKHKLQQLIIK
ncbi:RNA polymerase sigma factor [Mucilaginibacter antarcticus]|uniref:RNA polymerase sigma factor n=1 Tax=Mucilaginibacter antarcticus TaxID=1855725 RepID=A0ABW5XRF0_9SPHI